MQIWTVDDSETMARLIDAGVDGIFTDRIDILKEVLVGRGLWTEDGRGAMTDSDRVEAAELRPSLAVGGRLKRRKVLAWGLWDWGSSAYNAVITSFVFGPYVVRGVVGDAEPGGLSANTWLGISTAAAGFLVAAIAPITGQRADAGGHA